MERKVNIVQSLRAVQTISWWGFRKTLDINKDDPNKNKGKLFTQRLLKQGNQPPSLVFARDSKAGSICRLLIERKRECFSYALIGNFGRCGNKDHSNENKESL